MGQLEGKVALVTGAASGIGRATALKLAGEGARVVVADITADAGRAVADEVDGLFVATDVSRQDEMSAAVSGDGLARGAGSLSKRSGLWPYEARRRRVRSVCRSPVNGERHPHQRDLSGIRRETPMLAEMAPAFRDSGFPLLRPDDVADAVFSIVTKDVAGEVFVCQPGLTCEAYKFRGVPGPRTEGAEGTLPPLLGS